MYKLNTKPTTMSEGKSGIDTAWVAVKEGASDTNVKLELVTMSAVDEKWGPAFFVRGRFVLRKAYEPPPFEGLEHNNAKAVGEVVDLRDEKTFLLDPSNGLPRTAAPAEVIHIGGNEVAEVIAREWEVYVKTSVASGLLDHEGTQIMLNMG